MIEMKDLPNPYWEQVRSGVEVEVSGEVFDWFLNVIPPVGYGSRNGKSYSFLFAEGEENIIGFRYDGERYFAEMLPDINR